MAIDVNGIFGRWPVRTPGIWEPAGYLRLMDRFGIERALLTSTAALLDNTTLGNGMLADVVRRYPERFLGAGVINPNAGTGPALSEVERCLQQGFVALRLFPGLHGYASSDADILDPVMAEAERAGLPVIVTVRVSGQTGFPDTAIATVRALALRYPQVPIIAAGAGYAERVPLTRAAAACPNLHIEISQMQGGDAVGLLCTALGSARVLLGTGMGVLYASPALRRVDAANLPGLDREAILSGNARRLLRLP